MNKSLLSHNTDNWRTPSAIYKHYINNGYFDPCPYNEGPIEVDGLAIEWRDRNFVNPPYSNLKAWTIKALEEYKKGREVVLLIPARTDTQAFKMLYNAGVMFIFITGRLHFNDSKNPAPFPSMLVYLTNETPLKTSSIYLTNAKELEDPICGE